jgi:hypothetical protein
MSAHICPKRANVADLGWLKLGIVGVGELEEEIVECLPHAVNRFLGHQAGDKSLPHVVRSLHFRITHDASCS